jgi:hypothetical protein
VGVPASNCLADLRINEASRFRVCKTGTRIGKNASDLSTLEFQDGGTFTGQYNSFWYNQPAGNTGFQILAQGETPSGGSCKIDGRNNSTLLFRSGNATFQLGENDSTTQTTNQTLKAHNYTLSATGAGLVLAGGTGSRESGLVTLSGRGARIVSNSLSGTTLDLSQTWNTTQALTAISLNVTDTASNVNSMLMDLRVGGSSKFSVNKSGSVQVGAISASSGNSDQWSSTYVSFNTASGRYDSTYTSLNTNRAKYDSTYTTVSGNSANWNSTYNTVYTASGSWDYQGVDIKALTANWQSTYTTVSTYSAGWGLGGGTDNQTLSFNENNATLSILRGNTISLSALSGGGSGTGITVETDPIFTTWAQANSARYESTYTSFNTNSAKYDSVYTSFNTNSAKYNSVYTTVGANSAGWGSLSALNDVNIPSPVNGQVLQYSSATNKWIAGSPASATGATGYYGSFYDTGAGVLTANNQAKKVAIAQTFESNGITVSDSKIIFSHAGTYELIYSIQYKSLDNEPQDIYIWLRKNGIDVPL